MMRAALHRYFIRVQEPKRVFDIENLFGLPGRPPARAFLAKPAGRRMRTSLPNTFRPPCAYPRVTRTATSLRRKNGIVKGGS
jgi:hypothetical protein